MYLRLLTIMMLLIGSLAGCASEQITADEIVKRVQETLQTTNDVHAVVELSFTSPEESGSAKVEFWAKRDAAAADATEGEHSGKFRVKVLEVSAPEGDDVSEVVGTEVVMDGENVWAYMPGENRVYTGDLESMEDMMDRRGGGGRGGAPTDPMAAADQLRGMVEQGLASFDVEIIGEEQVSGHDAYKVKLTPKQEAQQQMNIELLMTTYAWIDKDRWVPLKVQIDAGSMGGAEITATTLDTNTGIGDDTFVYTPPAGADVVNIVDLFKSAQPEAMTLDEARAAAGFPVLVPEDAGDARLVQVQVIGTKEEGQMVVQVYSGPNGEFSVVQASGMAAETFGQREQSAGGAGSTEVDVRGVKGQLMQGQGSMSMLTWEENGVMVAVGGRVSGEQAQAIADSLR